MAVPLFMFAALIALGGDRGYFYRREVATHDYNTARTLAIAENLSPAHNFRLAERVWRNKDGGFEYDLYSRFPIGGFVLTRLAVLPFGDGLGARLVAARVLMLLMFCGAALFAYLSIARIAGSRRIAFAATLLAFSGFYAVYYADQVSNESVMDLFGAALAFHGMTVFVQEGRFRQLLAKTCAALFFGWHVYGLLLPFIAIGFGGEAVALLRSAASSCERAKAMRSALASLARSRYVALAAVSILFGSALLAFNLANEYAAYGGERALSETPSFQSIMRKLGRDEGGGEPYAGTDWDNFLTRQLYRVGVSVVPYALVRAGGYDFRMPEPLPSEVPLAPAVLGAAATCAALGAVAAVRRRRILIATAVLFGFCWGIPMRYNTAYHEHVFEGLPYMGLALALFAAALVGARRPLGGRLGGGTALAAAALAAPIFALSVFHAGHFQRDPNEAEPNKASMAELSEIRETARGKRVAIAANYHEIWGEVSNWYWGNQISYYRAGISLARADVCGDGAEGLLVSRYRDEALKPLAPENRMAFLYEDTSPLALCRAERRRLEASEPAARAAFDVYLRPDAVSYLKAPCAPSDYAAPFFAYLYPANPDDAPPEYRADGFHPWSAVRLEDRGAAFDGACMMTLYLPPYPITAVRTGQYIPGGRRLWEASIAPPPSAETLAIYERAYQAAAAREPAARSDFDLHLDDGALIYLKEPCDESDARGRFFLSVYPSDARDLPADRRESGHESLNFDFAPPAGAAFNGKCMATIRLPDYGISKIETGQWIPGGERLWSGEITVGD